MHEFSAGQYDIAVIGAGHAGIEAALAAARLGLETIIFTINLDAVGNMPLILHTHCTTGMAYMTVMKAIDSGVDVVDTATSCFSNGTSQPATETMFYALQQYGIKTGLNEDVINKVNDYFKPIKQKYVDSGLINPKSMATDAQALVYKVPGGMLSNMIANLKDMKAMDKFDAALAEIPSVRKDLGYPPLVTPLSQMVGNQAVVNVLMGERYKQISNEIKNYFKGEYGIAPGPSAPSWRPGFWARAASPWTAGSRTPSAPARSSRTPRRPWATWRAAKRT